MSRDSDSEIECWDAVKPSALNSSRATNVSPARGAFNAAVGPSSRSTQHSPVFTRKRKLSDALPVTQRSVPSRKPPPRRPADNDLIDLTEDNIEVDSPMENDSDSENSSDTKIEQEVPNAKSAVAKRVEGVASKKPASLSVEKPSGPSLSRDAKSSQQSSSKAQNGDFIDLTFEGDDSSIDSQDSPPPADSQKPAAASHAKPASLKAPTDDDSSSDGSWLKPKTLLPRKLNILQSSDESSQSSWSSLGVGVKKKASLAKIKAARRRKNFLRDDDDIQSSCSSIALQDTESDKGAKKSDTRVEMVVNLFDNDDSDSFCPSIATQNSASQSQGDENAFQPERQVLQGLSSGSMKSVTDSPAWTDTSASLVDERIKNGNTRPNQPNESSDMTRSKRRTSNGLIKRVRPCKGTRTTSPRAEIDDSDTDWDSGLSVNSEISSQPNECFDTKMDAINTSKGVVKRLRPCKGSRAAARKAETDDDESDTDWGMSASVCSQMSISQPNECSDTMMDTMNRRIAAKRMVTPREGLQTMRRVAQSDEKDSSWDASYSVCSDESNQPSESFDFMTDKGNTSTGVVKEVRLCEGSGTAVARAEDDVNGTRKAGYSVCPEVLQPPNESSNSTTGKRYTSEGAMKKVRPLKGTKTPVAVTDEIDTDWDTDVSNEFEEIETDLVACVASVCRATGAKGHPIRYYAVYGGDDDVLYDFRLFVDKSSIPNAGMGAFLTYMGARKINKDSATYKLCNDLLLDIIYEEPETMSHIIAVMPDGRTKAVKLCGDNLHCYYNCIYCPKSVELKNKAPSALVNGKIIKVKVAGECLETFHELKDRPKDGIGHLGMYRGEDYEHVSGVPCKPNLCIELDVPYAPLGPSDRKTSTLFDIKSFIFDNEPSVWAFDVKEKLLGQMQICDITDDTTGEPHTYARAEIPMYINEVGHSGLEANVYITQTHNRSPKYFIQLNGAMRPGETIELLTDYKKQYEPMRVRKGYGLKNIHRGDKSDDDPATRLNRNLDDRAIIEKLCTTLSLPDLTRVANYVSKKIWVPLCELVRSSYTVGRLLTDHLVSKDGPNETGSFVSALAKKPMTNLFCGYYIKACSTSLENICFPNDISLFDFLSQVEMKRNLRSTLREVSGAITREFIEQLYFDLRDSIRHPFLTNMWCPLGVNVLNRLGRDYAKLKLKYLERSQRMEGSELAKLLISEAAASSLDMDVAEISDFQFTSGTTCDQISFGLLQRILGNGKVEKSKALVERNDKTPKALHALAYTYLFETRKFSANEDIIFAPNKKFLVLCATDDNGSLESFVAEVGSAEAKQESAVLNRTYYKIWQIAHVLMSCARHYLDESGCNHVESEISKILGIERDLIAKTCGKPITIDKSRAAYLLYPEVQKIASDQYRSRVRKAREIQKSRIEKMCSSTRRSPSVKSSKVKAGGAQPKKRPEKKPKWKSTTLHASTESARPAAKEIYVGPPLTKLEYGGRSMQWPKGWTQKTFQRQTGDSRGQTDYYFYPPSGQLKIRSKADVFRYLDKLEACGGDESKIRHKSA